jgi:hypothetical protein
MKCKATMTGATVSFLLLGALVCHAEKWDKNDYTGQGIEAGFYNADSIKVTNKTVGWTEKYLITKDGSEKTTDALSKYKVCKESIVKKGSVTQFQVDYEIENNKKFRGVAKRYYNKDSDLICSNKDLGPDDFNTGWQEMVRYSTIETAYYDLVTKYKIVIK